MNLRPLGNDYGESARRVLALVCGLSPDARARVRLMVLRAYIDESCSDDLFVVAGFIASVDEWIAFSEDWSRHLKMGFPNYRHILEFHQSEMVNNEVVLEQSQMFFRVIERHLRTYVSCSLRVSELKRAHKNVAWPAWMVNSADFANEYYMSFMHLIYGLAMYQEHLALHDPIDLVFDERADKIKCIRGWDLIRERAPHDVRRLLGSTPAFQDSAQQMPLQAADLLAYWERKSQLAVPVYDKNYELNFPWEKRSTKMQYMHFYATEAMMTKNLKDVVSGSVLLRAGVHPDLIPEYLGTGSKAPPQRR